MRCFTHGFETMIDIKEKEHFYHDKVVIERTQDCSPILDDVKNFRNISIDKSSPIRHVARFPLVVVEQYAKNNGITFEEVMNNPEHFKRMYNDPDLSGFRIN